MYCTYDVGDCLSLSKKEENIMEAIEKIENSRLKLKMEEIVDGFLVSWY